MDAYLHEPVHNRLSLKRTRNIRNPAHLHDSLRFHRSSGLDLPVHHQKAIPPRARAASGHSRGNSAGSSPSPAASPATPGARMHADHRAPLHGQLHEGQRSASPRSSARHSRT